MRDTADAVGAVGEKTLDEEWPRESRGVNYIEGEELPELEYDSALEEGGYKWCWGRGGEDWRARTIVTNTRIVSCVRSLCARVLHKRVSIGARIQSTAARKRRRRHIHRRW